MMLFNAILFYMGKLMYYDIMGKNKLGFEESPSACKCGKEQTMSHLLICPLLPEKCNQQGECPLAKLRERAQGSHSPPPLIEEQKKEKKRSPTFYMYLTRPARTPTL